MRRPTPSLPKDELVAATRRTAATAGVCRQAIAVLLCLPLHLAAAELALEEILVVGERENRESRGALVLPASLYETPQSVTVVDAELIEDFALEDVNALLGLVPGVDVQSVETDRTYYTARGFDIKSMQVDGIGLPFNWNVVGALDTVIYDKVEIIRGANGLLTGTGNPSGTINYVRKRPTNDYRLDASVTGGSWDTRRIEGDLSGPLTESGSWAGRLVGAYRDGDSHLDLYENERSVLYGVVEGQLGNRATLTAGYTFQESDSGGVLWGALPMLYTDGAQTDFPRSTSTSMDWTQWETHNHTAFVEATYQLTPAWEARVTLTYNDYEESSELFYVYAFPGLDPATGTGLYGYPGKYESTSERTLLDGTLAGDYSLFGREHELLVGFHVSTADHGYFASPAPGDDPAWGALPPFPGWSGTEIGRPAFGERVRESDWESDLGRMFAVTRLNVTEALDVILGVNAIDVESKGYSFDEPQDASEREVSPYVGVMYEFAGFLNAYASYSDIYEPQPEIDENLGPLGAAQGKSYELGLKADLLDHRLLGAVAVFRADQDNYAEYAGFDASSGLSYYRGVDVESEGVEAEVSGLLTDTWSIQAGYTYLELEDPGTGDDVRTFVPRKTFKLATRYTPAWLPKAQFGGSVQWQDDVHLDSAAGEIRQDARAVLSAFMSYALLPYCELSVNVNNLTDVKYLTSLYWDQSYYAAPRNVMATLRVIY